MSAVIFLLLSCCSCCLLKLLTHSDSALSIDPCTDRQIRKPSFKLHNHTSTARHRHLPALTPKTDIQWITGNRAATVHVVRVQFAASPQWIKVLSCIDTDVTSRCCFGLQLRSKTACNIKWQNSSTFHGQPVQSIQCHLIEPVTFHLHFKKKKRKKKFPLSHESFHQCHFAWLAWHWHFFLKVCEAGQ